MVMSYFIWLREYILTVLWIKLRDHTSCSWVKQSINRSLPSIAQNLFFSRIDLPSQWGTFDVCAAAFSAFSSAVNHENGDYSQSRFTDTRLYGHLAASYPDVSLSMKMCAQRKAGRSLPSVLFPWSLAVHHQSLAFRARLCQEKNEAPEEEAGHLAITGSLPCPWEKKALAFSFNSARF